MKARIYISIFTILILMWSCEHRIIKQTSQVTAKDILGNAQYLAISYGGYRQTSRDIQPSISQLKEDMKILYAMGIRILRTYNVQLAQAPNLLKAIRELKQEDQQFEMYVMLGAWIDCKNAWTDQPPNHELESDQNKAEIERAVALANEYPEIVKIIAVGNEAMVKWAASYYVQPRVILKWVNYLQNLKKEEKLPKDLWITSSDDFVSWGGGEERYRIKNLEELVKAVDYVSMHTYPYHNSHYNPAFWYSPEDADSISDIEKVDAAMQRAVDFAKNQYTRVSEYIKSIGVSKPIHIGETGWATISNGFYGQDGSRASDQYKEALYYELMREWTNKAGISCFYFEAFDEPWKDAHNPKGSENHFGLITVDGKAKYVLWDMVEQGVFEGLYRDGNLITKTYRGNKEELLKDVQIPPQQRGISVPH